MGRINVTSVFLRGGSPNGRKVWCWRRPRTALLHLRFTNFWGELRKEARACGCIMVCIACTDVLGVQAVWRRKCSNKEGVTKRRGAHFVLLPCRWHHLGIALALRRPEGQRHANAPQPQQLAVWPRFWLLK